MTVSCRGCGLSEIGTVETIEGYDLELESWVGKLLAVQVWGPGMGSQNPRRAICDSVTL